jgi:hypothetical protein
MVGCGRSSVGAPAPASGDEPPRAAQDQAVAIERGLSYLRAHRSDASALGVLDYLRRKYGLADDLAFEKVFDGPAGTLGLWGRIVGRDPAVDAGALGSLEGRVGTTPIVLHALYCDRVPLPPDFGPALEKYAADEGFEGYELTHAALALKLLSDNRCGINPDVQTRLTAFLRDGMRRRLAKSEQEPHQRSQRDVRYETLAFLQDVLEQHDLGEELFARLLSEQDPDGGWRPHPDQPTAPHPTVLAVWALLARQHPDVGPTRFASD